MASPPPAVVSPTTVQGITRQWPVPACSLTVADLRRLFDILTRKASEAATEQVGQLQRSQVQTDEEFIALQNEVRSVMGLVVRIQGATGEWTVANFIDAIREDLLPAVIMNIVYECGPLFSSRFRLFPQNQFSITIDFTHTQLGDLSNLALGGIGSSVVNVSGVNFTWINAVDHELRVFFAERKIRRDWLHSRFAYDFALFFVGVPVCLDAIYNLDKRLAPLVEFPPAVFVALYVYLMLVGLLGFRILFNYAKWIFPKIEGPSQRSRAGIHKAILTAIFLALLVRSVTAILWVVGIHLFSLFTH